VLDVPYRASRSATIRIARFPETFAEKNIAAWATDYSWGVGFGNMAHTVRNTIEDLDASHWLRVAYEEGEVAGGTSQIFNLLTGEDAFDFSLPGNLVQGYQVDSDLALVPAGDHLAPLKASELMSGPDLRPRCGLYLIYPF